MNARKQRPWWARAPMLLGVSVLSLLALVAGVVAWSAVQSASASAGAEQLSDIHDQVAADAVAQYRIARKSDDRMQVCVQAWFVAAAYLQAKNEAQFLQWKETEKADCEAAGVPK